MSLRLQLLPPSIRPHARCAADDRLAVPPAFTLITMLRRIGLCLLLLLSAATARAAEQPSCGDDTDCIQTRALSLLAAGQDAQGVLAQLHDAQSKRAAKTALSAAESRLPDDDAMALAVALRQVRVALRPLLARPQLDAAGADRLARLFDQLESQQLLYSLRFAQTEAVLRQFQAGRAQQRLATRRQAFTEQWRAMSDRIAAVRLWLSKAVSAKSDGSTVLAALSLPYAAHQQFLALDLAIGALAPETQRAAGAPQATFGAGLRPLPQQRPGLIAPALPSGPAIVPSYASGVQPPVALAVDLAPGPDTELTEAIRAKAASLHHDPVQLFDFVYTQIETAFYPGARQTADQVLQSGRGNDIDQASLLIALLRASQTPARYVEGVIELPAAELAQLLGVPESRIGRALHASGIPHEPVQSGGQVKRWRVLHTWVSTWLPYSNYRGNPIDASAPIWLPLAPALKQYAQRPGSDLLGRAGLSGAAWVSQWLGQAPVPADDSALPLTALRTQLVQWLATQPPPLAPYEAQLASRVLDTPPLQVLPAGMPFPVTVVLAETAVLREDQHQQLTLRIRQGSAENDPVTLDVKLPLAAFNDRRISLSYAPATVDDAILLNLRGAYASLPAWLIQLRAQVLIDGRPVASSTTAFEPGQVQRLDLLLQSPAGALGLSQELTVGSLHQLRISDLSAATLAPASLPNDAETEAAAQLSALARRYTSTLATDSEEIARLTGVVRFAPWPAVDLVISQVQPLALQGLVERLEFKGVALDAALHSVEAIGTQATDAAAARAEGDYYHLAGLQGSALEADTFQRQWSVAGTSADRLLRQARRQNVDVLSLNPGQVASAAGLSHPASVLAQLQQWLDLGYTVQIPRIALTADSWTGSGWRVWKADTGEAGYFLSGGYAGGLTIPPPDRWSLQALVALLGDPFARPANPDPLSGAYLVIDETTDRQSGRAGERLPTPLAVYLFDASGRPVKGGSVRFTVESGTATLPDGALQFTDPRGKAVVPVQLGQRLGDVGVYVLPAEGAQPEFHGVSAIRGTASAQGRSLTTAKDLEARVKAGPPARWASDWVTKIEVETLGAFPPPVYHLPAGLEYRLIRVAIEDAHGNRVANAPIQYSSTVEPYYPTCSYDGQAPKFFTAGQCPAKFRYESDCGQASGEVPSASRPLDLFVQPTDKEQATGLIRLASPGLPDVTYRWADPGTPASCGHRLHAAVFARWVVRPSGQAFLASTESRFTHPNEPGPLEWLELGTPTSEAAPPGEWLARPQRYTFAHRVNDQYQPMAALQRLTDPAQCTSGPNYGRNVPCVQMISTGEAGIPYITGTDLWLPLRMPDVPGRSQGTVNVLAVLDAQTGHGTRLLLHADGYAVEALNTVSPADVEASPHGVTLADVRARTRIVPREYAAISGMLILKSADQVLEENAVPEPGPELEFTIPRGFNASGTGEVKVATTLNAGTPWEIESEAADLRVRYGLVRAFGIEPKDNVTGQPRPLADGEFKKTLLLSTVVDVPRQFVCRNNRDFVFVLARPAAVTVDLQRVDSLGTPAGDPSILLEGDLPAGEKKLRLTTELVPPGQYQMRLFANDLLDPRVREAYGISVMHVYDEQDSRSFGHSTFHDVNVFDGALGLQRTDLTVPGRGPTLAMRRSYTSQFAVEQPGYMGWGWSSALQQRVVRNDCGEVTVIGADTGAQSFVLDRSEGTVDIYKPLKGSHGDLRFERDQPMWVFHRPDGQRFEYGESRFTPRMPGFRLTRIVDPSGQALTLTHEPVGDDLLLNRIASADGRYLSLEYAPKEVRFLHVDVATQQTLQLLTRVRSSADDTVEYAYDDYGNLLSTRLTRGGKEGFGEKYGLIDLGRQDYVGADGKEHVAQYGWKLEKIIDRESGDWRQLRWLRELTRIISQGEPEIIPAARVNVVTEADDGAWDFRYLGERGSLDVRTEVRDPRGQLHRYSMNRYGAVTDWTDPAGTVLTEWNMLHMKPASVTDRLGLRTEWTYDTHGNTLTERRSGIGPSLNRSWTFRAPEEFDPPFIKNLPATERDARGIETGYGYDTHGRRTRVTRGGVSDTWTYAANGDLVSASNGEGETTTYSYTPVGLTASEFAPLGATRTHTYDRQGRRETTQDERGVVTRWTYDGRDRVTRIEDPIGVRTLAHLPRGRTETDELGRVTRYAYDGMQREVRIERYDGVSLLFEESQFDQVGNLLQQTDTMGRVTTHTYNAASHRVRTVAPGGLVIDYSHDAEGHLLTETRSGAGGVRTLVQEYGHPLYQPTKITRGGIAIEARTYDGNGNLVQRIDPRGYTTIQEYDARDRLVTRTEPEGRITTFSWDGADRQTLESLSSGWKRSTEYNALGQAVAVTDGEGKSLARTHDLKGNVLTQTDRRGAVITWTYDPRGRKQTETGPVPGLQTTWTYNGVNNVETETRANGQVLTHSYDQMNRRTETRDADGILETLTYDKAGNLLTQTDANGRVTRYEYNALNQRTRQSAPENRISAITPSVHGEVLSETLPTGGITMHDYDALGRRIKTTFPITPSDSSAPFARWTYDPSGNVTTATDARGFETISEYDGLNRRRTQTDPAPLSFVQEWTYDTAGNVQTWKDRNAILTAYTYDTENRRKTTTRAGILRETLEHDGEGGLIARVDGLSRRTAFVLDALGRIVETRMPENIVRSQTWTPLGDLETVNDGSGRITRFSYDLRRRKFTETNGANETTRFAYDAVGNLRLQAHPLFTAALPALGDDCAFPGAPSHTMRFCYDDANRLIGVIDPERNKTSYEYDLNDNLIAVIEPLGNRSQFQFDQRN